SGIDLNRAGTPLIEIVSEPDMRNSEEAVSFARKLHSIVTSLRICDGNMSQGSMRFDVNISVRRPGEPLGTRTETKNLNSFRFMEEAIAMEVDRQIEILEDGGKIQQETRLYNGDTKTARAMRSKEEANDYRYFPCPDLLPVIIDDDLIETLRESLPELPDARHRRFIEQYKLSDYDASQLSDDAATADFFEASVAINNDPKMTANWMMGEITARLNAEEKTIAESPLSPDQLAELITRIKDGALSSKMAKEVFDHLWQDEKANVDKIIEAMGGGQVSDQEALNAIIDEVITTSRQQTDNYRNADEKKRPKMMGYFVGQVMKASKGKANPQLVNQLLQEKLNNIKN
ncbi:MAG: Asp-tRNA(Asn)/Glu-tRNA(Gln) amidotransferase subunit GatB, partial [Gammaproteobacteria bacterium]|nr:Asp-tRNA(Asn)/Glu-tRNA(Gln) amidotransferase subunit GatB [Gammaproteobacteria bacterium]